MSDDKQVIYSRQRDLPLEQILRLYVRRNSSYLQQPQELYMALMKSHTLVSAWCNGRLIGIGNAISDGHLFVYYPHVLVDPVYRRRGIGREILTRLTTDYRGFQQHASVADTEAASFFRRCGFSQQSSGQVMLGPDTFGVAV